MDYNITALVISIILVAWQVMVWKKIKLPKWIDYILSGITIGLLVWLIYLTFLSGLKKYEKIFINYEKTSIFHYIFLYLEF